MRKEQKVEVNFVKIVRYTGNSFVEAPRQYIIEFKIPQGDPWITYSNGKGSVCIRLQASNRILNFGEKYSLYKYAQDKMLMNIGKINKQIKS